jgi:1-deoxy-D-xylulose-5-phosphate reductoisomerase
LDVIGQHESMFRVTALAGATNATLLAKQAARFRPPYLAVISDEVAHELQTLLPSGYAPEILTGPTAYVTLAELEQADLVLSTIVGAAGFLPTLAAAKAGKAIALANKESLVLGGHLIREACQASGAVILPVDSEHNALFQGLMGHNGDSELKKLILTASGGPFRGRDRKFLETVTRDQALAHPNWDMGAKISIDSSTLMNKGLEIIEACHLYGLPMQQVDVVVHPQSIIHSLVEYVDGSQLAHLGVPDMRIPIAHCLCFPRRVPLDMPGLNLADVGNLTFEQPDMQAFPCLRLAREAFESGPAHTIALNAANEVAVELFLKERIRYMDIPAIIEHALESVGNENVACADSVLALDRATREKAMTRA